MQEDKTPLGLRVLLVESVIALFLPILLSIIGTMEGKNVDIATTGPYLFAGLIGISAYEVSSRLHKRVVALENQSAGSEDDFPERY